MDLIHKQVVSKQRVADHGEVYTSKREVNAMLDLVKQEAERIESRFLEPACGIGNFLVEILARKLHIVESRYAKSQLDYERYAVLAVSSLYGIDILLDNVEACRRNLFEVFDESYCRLFKRRAKEQCRQTICIILQHNVIWGDALTLRTIGATPRPIVFAEWSLVGTRLKRRDYEFEELLPGGRNQEANYSDEGHLVFSPRPVREFPPVHFLRIADLEPDTIQPRCIDMSSQSEQR